MGQWIDDVARALASGANRRTALKRLGAGLLGAAGVSFLPAQAAAQGCTRCGTTTVACCDPSVAKCCNQAGATGRCCAQSTDCCASGDGKVVACCTGTQFCTSTATYAACRSCPSGTVRCSATLCCAQGLCPPAGGAACLTAPPACPTPLCNGLCCPAGAVCFNNACCTPESTATTCAGKCGTVPNNCGQPVTCPGVTAVKGEAFGYFASVSLFGGPPGTRGPAPTVTLAPDASNSPQSAQLAEGLVQFGPAIIFSSGLIDVSTQGTIGPGGSVTSTTSIQNVNRSQQEVFTASSISSTCTASGTGVSGSTTITNGTLQTSEGNPNVDGDEVVVPIPTNPAPNTTINGQIETVGDSFQYIFNEQIINPDGSIIVYAAHLRLLGPTAVGDLYIGKSVCGVTTSSCP